MALAGGETAQMPGLYAQGHYDLAGTIVGVVEEAEALHGDAVRPGRRAGRLRLDRPPHQRLHPGAQDPADDLHLGVHDPLPGHGQSVADALLAVHRSYYRAVAPVLSRVHALAHITGGGIPGNLVRVLPDGLRGGRRGGSWPWPPLFRLLQEAGKVSTEEMRDVFNLGVGMIAVVPPSGGGRGRGRRRGRWRDHLGHGRGAGRCARGAVCEG